MYLNKGLIKNLKYNKRLFFVIILSLYLGGCVFTPSRYGLFKTYIFSSPKYDKSNVEKDVRGKKIYVEDELEIHNASSGAEESITSDLNTNLISKGFIIAQKDEADFIIRIKKAEVEDRGPSGFMIFLNAYGYITFKFEVIFSKRDGSFTKKYNAIQRYWDMIDWKKIRTTLVERLGQDIYNFASNNGF